VKIGLRSRCASGVGPEDDRSNNQGHIFGFNSATSLSRTVSEIHSRMMFRVAGQNPTLSMIRSRSYRMLFLVNVPNLSASVIGASHVAGQRSNSRVKDAQLDGPTCFRDIWLIGVIAGSVLRSSRPRAIAPRTAACRPPLQTCRSTVERRSPAVRATSYWRCARCSD
jgi:hypothetical protein